MAGPAAGGLALFPDGEVLVARCLQVVVASCIAVMEVGSLGVGAVALTAAGCCHGGR